MRGTQPSSLAFGGHAPKEVLANDNETSSHDHASRHFRTWNSGSRLCCRYRRWLWWRIGVRFARDHHFALDHDDFALNYDDFALKYELGQHGRDEKLQ